MRNCDVPLGMSDISGKPNPKIVFLYSMLTASGVTFYPHSLCLQEKQALHFRITLISCHFGLQ